MHCQFSFYHIIREPNFPQDNTIQITSFRHKLPLMLISIGSIQELLEKGIANIWISIIESRDLNKFNY